jgi:hypothetical protein
MMNSTVITQQKLFGLLELDAEGKIIYSRIESGEDMRNFADDIKGLNFYTEVAPFKNVGEFQRCLDAFRQSSQQAQTIGFTCEYDDGPVQVRVLMARIRGHSEYDSAKSMLVHIRKTI